MIAAIGVMTSGVAATRMHRLATLNAVRRDRDLLIPVATGDVAATGTTAIAISAPWRAVGVGLSANKKVLSHDSFVNEVVTQDMRCARGDLNPHVLSNTGT